MGQRGHDGNTSVAMNGCTTGMPFPICRRTAIFFLSACAFGNFAAVIPHMGDCGTSVLP
jgi:hypothetical protein